MKSLKITQKVHDMVSFFKKKYKLKSASNFLEVTLEIIDNNKILRDEIIKKCDLIKNSGNIWYKDMERKTFSESAIDDLEK